MLLNSLEKIQTIKGFIRQYFLQDQHKVDLSFQDIHLQALPSLTNDVYKILTPIAPPLLYKMYQPTLPEFTDTQLEAQIVTSLSQRGLYPKILKSTSVGRIEQYVNSTPISPTNSTEEILVRIVVQLANFSCDYKQLVSIYNTKKGLDNRYNLQRLLMIFADVYKCKKQQCPELVSKCQKQIETVLYDHNLINNLSQMFASVPLVLSHNDCHLGNILVNESKQFIIDYEFSQFNYVGFDLANFYNEWSIQYGQTFQIRQNLQINHLLRDKISEVYYSQIIKKYDIKIQELAKYTQLGRVLSHLFWMIIGLKQINDSRINFSMVYYVIRRKQELFKHYHHLIKNTT